MGTQCNHSHLEANPTTFRSEATDIQLWPDAGLPADRELVMGLCPSCETTLMIEVAADSELANLARDNTANREPEPDYMALALLSMGRAA